MVGGYSKEKQDVLFRLLNEYVLKCSSEILDCGMCLLRGV